MRLYTHEPHTRQCIVVSGHDIRCLNQATHAVRWALLQGTLHPLVLGLEDLDDMRGEQPQYCAAHVYTAVIAPEPQIFD